MTTYLINILVLICIINSSDCFGLPKLGPVGTIKIEGIETCTGNDPGTNVAIKNGLIGGDINIPNAIDDTAKFAAVFDIYNNGVLVKNFHTFKGDSCTFIKKNAPKGYEKVVKLLTPKIPMVCPAPKGKYKLAGLPTVYTKKDMNLPAIFYGKFIATLTVTKNNKLFVCLKISGDSIKK